MRGDLPADVSDYNGGHESHQGTIDLTVLGICERMQRLHWKKVDHSNKEGAGGGKKAVKPFDRFPFDHKTPFAKRVLPV